LVGVGDRMAERRARGWAGGSGRGRHGRGRAVAACAPCRSASRHAVPLSAAVCAPALAPGQKLALVTMCIKRSL
jgi:hypothetical protein